MKQKYCGARRRSGGTCRKPAGWGTKHTGYGTCKLHGGSTPSAEVFARALAGPDQARKVAKLLGLENWEPLAEADVTAMEAAISCPGHDSPGLQEPRRAVREAACGARTRQGKQPCRRPAGWGTSHVGWGNCKLHAGSTRNGVKHAHRLEVQMEVFRWMARAHRAQGSTPITERLIQKQWIDVRGRKRAREEET